MGQIKQICVFRVTGFKKKKKKEKEKKSRAGRDYYFYAPGSDSGDILFLPCVSVGLLVGQL